LPAARREALGRQFVLPRVVWSATYSEEIDGRILNTLQKAIGLGRQLAFDYRSNYDSDTQPRRYHVAPYEIFFRDGHTYLDSTVMLSPPDRTKLRHRAIPFRLDRIVHGSARMLPESIPEARPLQPVFQIVYVLAPAVARNRDVAHWFPHTVVEYQEDGSAHISAQVTNLWQARQILMRYIEHCQVLEPPELVDMMRETVAHLAALYSITTIQ
jgi:predicted DNA-binding transcriptional regulator YafY